MLKKLIFTVLFTLTAIVFSQQVYRQNDSTFVYPCITTDSTDYNMVGLPLQTYYVNASDFDPAGTNIEAVSVWDVTNQYYKTAVYSPYFGWIKDFPVKTGGAYFINSKNNFDLTVIGDSVNFVYNLTVNPQTGDLNPIVLPLSKANLTTSAKVGDDIGVSYCNSIQKWNATTQSFMNTVQCLKDWKQVYNTYMADPLVINMKNSKTWPSIKYESDINEFIESSDTDKSTKGSSGGPRLAFFHIIKELDSTEFVYPSETDTLTFRAWMTSNPYDIVRQNSYDCGFINLGSNTAAYVNLKSFANGVWYFGDELNIEFTLPTGIDTCSVTLDNQSSTVWVGFEPLIPGTGQPIALDYLYGIPGVPTTSVNGNTLQLSWNSALGATGYNIYSSDDPYGTFSYLATTTTTSWQKSVTPGKKFFYVTATNDTTKNAKKTIEVKKENNK